jgi:predicted esterase
MKYLLLHGYTQNGEIMKKKILDFLPKNTLDSSIISPNGPIQISENSYGWWPLDNPMSYTKEQKYKNTNAALDVVFNCLKDVNEFTIIAFSQGSVVAELLLISDIKPAKVLLFSPSGNMDLSLVGKINNEFPILVFSGEKEDIFGVTIEHYKKYTSFTTYEHILHKQGHVIPSQSVDKQKIKLFLK